jgi:RNA recognition motif-containing protein
MQNATPFFPFTSSISPAVQQNPPRMKKQTKQTANTVFFRYSPCNIPSVDHRYFESYFSEVGPVKKCSLIRSSKREGKSAGDDMAPENRGFGFIKFISQDDALTAAKNCNGITLHVDNTALKIWVELASDAVKSRPTQSSHTPPTRNERQREMTNPIDTNPTDTPLDDEESDLQRPGPVVNIAYRSITLD